MSAPRSRTAGAGRVRTSGHTPAGTPYVLHGRGDSPVVLVAGAGGAGRIWENHQVPALLAAGHRVVTFDHAPARGRCPTELAASVAELVKSLGLPPCPLVGHSLGAMAVQELLVNEPHRASAAVLVATRHRIDAAGEGLRRAEAAVAEAGIRLPPAYEAFVRLVQNLSPRTLADERATAEWLDLFEFAASTGQAISLRQSPPVRHTITDYGGVRVPVLVVGFADDVLAPAPLGREVARAIPRARYTELADAGHLGFLERPETFNAVLLDFLATLHPGATRVP